MLAVFLLVADERFDDSLAGFTFVFVKRHLSFAPEIIVLANCQYRIIPRNFKPMNLPPLTRDQVRSVDQRAIDQYGMSGLVLMENAGRGAAEIIAGAAGSGEILILCGRGNNAGDGYVIARHLELMGRNPRILSLVPLESLQGDALANARIARAANIECEFIQDIETLQRRLGSPATLVECLLGTGARGAPRELMGDAVRLANALNTTRIAIDVPAGLDCDTGEASDPTLRADHTISFVASKVGFLTPSAANFVGHVHTVGIGVPKRLLDEVFA